jgi:acyl carrier protein
MDTQELINLFAESIEAEPSTLTPGTIISEVPDWNSLGWLTIMSLLDERYAIQLTAPQIRNFKTVNDVVEAVKMLNRQLIATSKG